MRISRFSETQSDLDSRLNTRHGRILFANNLEAEQTALEICPECLTTYTQNSMTTVFEEAVGINMPAAIPATAPIAIPYR